MDNDNIHGRDIIETHRPGVPLPALQPLLQSLASTLANIDIEYEKEREQMCVDPRDGSLKLRILQKLTSKHEERRRPYVEQMILLQDRIREASQR